MLRAVVEEHRKAAQQAMEAEIRAAVKALRAAGHAVTMIAVCRTLGKHRSYVEKRGRLRLLVWQAGRPT
jgi:putative intracellular protease/amidase